MRAPLFRPDPSCAPDAAEKAPRGQETPISRELFSGDQGIAWESWQAALAARHGKERQEKLSAATVAICGLGGLGSHLAFAFARVGIGHLILIDFDRVDLANLHRQNYRADQVGRYKTEALAEELTASLPHLHLTLHTCRLNEDNIPRLLSGADLVCEAFDDPAAKAMLTDTVLTRLPRAFLVAASGMAGFGSPNAIITRKITPRFYLCGDGVSAVGKVNGLFCPRVMLCAAHEALTALRLLCGEET